MVPFYGSGNILFMKNMIAKYCMVKLIYVWNLLIDKEKCSTVYKHTLCLIRSQKIEFVY